MELKGSGGNFFKFETVGQSITGKVVGIDTARESPWGLKTEITLDVEDKGEVRISCPTALANLVKENAELLLKEKPVLSIRFTGTAANKKGSPTKLFKVETVEVTPF